MNISKKSGFTLTEVMISVALVGLIIGLSVASWTALARGAAISKQWSLMHAELRSATDMMSRDLASASSVHNVSTNWFGVNATSTGGTFLVYYVRVNNGDFWRVAPSGNQKLATDVTGFDFTFYEDDGLTTTTVAGDAFSVDITLETEKAVADEVFDDMLQTRIMFRNKLL